MSSRQRICLILIATGLVLWPPARLALTAEPSTASGIEAITKPSEDRKLGFMRPGVLGKVMVKEGQAVKQGDLLVQQECAAEMAQLEQQKASAEDQTRVKAAKAQLEQKKVELVKLERAFKRGASTELEVENARLGAVIGQYQLDVEMFQRDQDARKLKELQFQIDRMQIKSPINGRVEEIALKDGESSNDATIKIIRVVSIDPLYVDVPVPMAQTQKLQSGSQVEVRFTGPAAATVKGEVLFLAAVADGASSTRLVRVQVPNPTGRPAGEHVEVRIPDSPPAAVADNQKTGPTATVGAQSK